MKFPMSDESAVDRVIAKLRKIRSAPGISHTRQFCIMEAQLNDLILMHSIDPNSTAQILATTDLVALLDLGDSVPFFTRDDLIRRIHSGHTPQSGYTYCEVISLQEISRAHDALELGLKGGGALRLPAFLQLNDTSETYSLHRDHASEAREILLADLYRNFNPIAARDVY